MFVCSYTPYKAVISVPRMVSGFTTEEMKTYTKDCSKPLTNLPGGYFAVIGRTSNSQVALFKYLTPAGCRKTNSPRHLGLPPPYPFHKNAEKITKEPNVRVGFPYMFGHDQPYTIQKGAVVVGKPTLPNRRTSSTELNRMAVMMGSLLQKYGRLLDIESSQDNSKFCPFKGGGDIHLRRKNTSSAAVIHQPALEDDDDESTPLSVATYNSLATSRGTVFPLIIRGKRV